jgi:hypothetical protein
VGAKKKNECLESFPFFSADDRSRRKLTAELKKDCGYPYEFAYVGPSQPRFFNTDTRQSFHEEC